MLHSLSVGNQQEPPPRRKLGWKESDQPLKLVHHKRTELIPTYLLNFFAGPFSCHPSQKLPKLTKQSTSSPKYNLSIYFRKSVRPLLKNHLDDILKISETALGFYEEFFDCEYKFHKLDSVFCPEYWFEAMEGPAAIAYSENLLPKPESGKTELDIGRVAIVVFHEIAHMWFGNVVTMEWWDGLWLNEAFVELISHIALSSCLKKLEGIFEEDFDPW